MTIEAYRQKIGDIFERLEVISKSNMGGVKIGDLCAIKGGKRIPKGMGFCGYKTEHPYLRVTDFAHRGIMMEDLQYIDDAVFENIKNYTISSDDVYISIAGTIGLVGMVPIELNGANLTENAAKLVVKDKTQLNAEFLSFALNTDFVQSQIKSETHAVGVPKLALSRIEKISIILPSLQEQQKAVEQAKRYEQLIAQATEVMEGCASRKRAVLNKYLNVSEA